jgi:hypothetical protein
MAQNTRQPHAHYRHPWSGNVGFVHKGWNAKGQRCTASLWPFLNQPMCMWTILAIGDIWAISEEPPDCGLRALRRRPGRAISA